MADTNVADVYPLSPLQESMLFHTLLDPSAGTFVVQFTCLIEGQLDEADFRAAWQAVVDRHPALRTLFLWERQERPIQVVRKSAEVPWGTADWSDVSAHDQERDLDALLARERGTGFDFSRAPLMRFHLIRTSESTHRFVWSVHHLLLDGWSVGVILTEVYRLYAARGHGTTAMGEPKPYRDYIGWLRRQDMAAAEDYWRTRLGDITDGTKVLMGTASAEGGEGGAGAEVHAETAIQLDEDSTERLEDLARREGLTLGTLVHGAWALLLSHYGGKDDVLFGTTVSGRPEDLDGVESMVGLFINTLPVRVRVDRTARCVDWLRRLQSELLELRAYEFTPLEQAHGWSGIPRSQPLFESLVNVHTYPKLSGQQDGQLFRLEQVRTRDRTAYPLTLMAVPGRRMLLHLLYDRRRCGAVAAEQLVRHLGALLRQVAKEPRKVLDDLELMTEEERQGLFGCWNASQGEIPWRMLHELVEDSAARSPDAVAVASATEEREAAESLTYAELNGRADRLAAHLRALGIRTETLVGISLSRTSDLVVAVLAALKAGGAYLPLDPNYPIERLSFMLRDSGAPVVIGTRALAQRLAGDASWGAHWVCLDEAESWQAADPCDSRGPTEEGDRLDRLAYVIYTSGSTGTPKGVEVTHRNAVNLLQSMRRELGLSAEDVLFAVTSLNFDIALLEIFLPLMVGARVVLARRDVVSDGEALGRQLSVQGATVMQATPSTWSLLLSSGWQGAPQLKALCGGEAMTRDLADRLLDRCGLLWNVYGPTETTVWSTCRRVERGTGPVSVGGPVANTQVHVLDDRMRRVPPGVRGELFIGGAGVARGYRGRPDLTAARFLPDPFGQEPGARFYRTGDLASWLHDGQVMVHGRTDHQIKVRGFRVEPGEIEEVLCRMPEIREAVVVATQGTDARLVGYIVAAGTRPEDARVREFLHRFLPEPMVPSLLVWLDALPRTPNGKVDRQALPVPRAGRPSSEYVAPRNPVEAVLARLWAEVLQLERVGVEDSFFDLGGHSLLTARLAVQVRQTFQMQVPMRALFDAATVAQMARTLIQHEPKPGHAMAVAGMIERLRDLSPADRQRLLEQKRRERAVQEAACGEVSGSWQRRGAQVPGR